MEQKNSNEYDNLCPGKKIKSEIKKRGLSQKQLAEQIGLRPSHLSEIISGKRTITISIAQKLQDVLSISAKEWINLQTDYNMLSNVDNDELQAMKLLEQIDEIVSLKTIFNRAKYQNKSYKERLSFVHEKLGISSYEDLKYTSEKLISGYFKRSEKTGSDKRMIATWVCLAQKEAKEKNVNGVFSRDSLEELKKELRIIFTQNDNTIYKLMGVFDKYGIKFCIVEKTDHASIDGYSFMDSNGIPSIVVTTRFKRIDNLAFAVMHEVCHVFKHLSLNDYQRINIFDEDIDSKEENEANNFASNALIPQELWNTAPQVPLNPFVIQKKYSQWASVNNINKWIVLGRISHETGMYKFKTDQSRNIN